MTRICRKVFLERNPPRACDGCFWFLEDRRAQETVRTPRMASSYEAVEAAGSKQKSEMMSVAGYPHFEVTLNPKPFTLNPKP